MRWQKARMGGSQRKSWRRKKWKKGGERNIGRKEKENGEEGEKVKKRNDDNNKNKIEKQERT